MKYIIFIISFLLSLQGCSWIFPKTHPIPASPAFALDNVQMVNAKLLQAGGTIEVVPFTAGVSVEANQDMERLVLSMIQGLTETINDIEQENSLKVVFGEEAREADFLITGHVINFDRPSRLKKLTPLRKIVRVKIEGRMMSQRTGETIFLFTHHKEMPAKQFDPRSVGKILGNDLGRYLLSVL